MPMQFYELIKHIHITCVAISILGYLLRLYWLHTSSSFLSNRAIKTLPHIIDTLLLSSGVTLAIMLHISPFSALWFGAKLAAVLIYITAGIIAFRQATLRVIAVPVSLMAVAVAITLALLKPL